jgi:hypothetical protein
VSSLRAYYRTLPIERERPDGHITRMELSDWWKMPEDARQRVLEQDAQYDFGYVDFVVGFLPKRLGVNRDRRYRFFDSMCLHVSLLLSEKVELRRVESLRASCSAFCHGIFARCELSCSSSSSSGRQITEAAVRGQLVQISEEEEQQLRERGAAHSLLHMLRKDVPNTRVPDELVNADAARDHRAAVRGDDKKRPEERRTAASTAQQVVCFVVSGAVSFLNHACAGHSNAFPCVYWNDNDFGVGQWRVISLKRTVAKGEELWVEYSGGEQQQQPFPCMSLGCAN